jgi:branched-chain amino acid transport system substrate-binding protein
LRVALLAAAVLGIPLGTPVFTPGVTTSSILIGGTAPLSDAGAQGAEAYLKYVNARGGVHGRRIVYRYLDDGANPERTVSIVQRLVERDRVFAIFNSVGTSTNLAVRDYLNARKVPQLFVASASSVWGLEARNHQYTVGFSPTYRAEGTVYGRYLSNTQPTAKIAVLYQDDDDGKDLLSGLRRGLAGRAGNIVKAVGYIPIKPDLESQMAQLKRTRASVLMVFCLGRCAVQAFGSAAGLGWRPQVFVHGAGLSKVPLGAISAAFVKDPADPFWIKDPGNKLFQNAMKAAGLGSAANLRNASFAAGMASAFTLVDTLEKAGEDLSRADAVKATARLNEANNPFLLPGIVVKAGPIDRFPIEQVQLQRWNGSRWVRFGGLVTAKS